MSVLSIYPRVYKSNERQTVYVRLNAECAPEIKIQPMEAYSIPHSERCRIDEEDRYPYQPLVSLGGGLFCTDYDFRGEQKYSVRVKEGERVTFRSYLYALEHELASLVALKGDTHMHSCRSDGTGTPFELACNYCAAGFDFIAVTDHHKYAPSLEARDAVSALTGRFTVFSGEEVHNKDMGYFHVVNFGGSSSVNDIIESDDEYVARELVRIKSERSFPEGVNADTAAYRIFISEHIRRTGGVSILAHPFWDVYGEYNMEARELEYHLTEGTFDAFELFAADDRNGNGDNLQVALWCGLLSRGVNNTSVLGASDCHDPVGRDTLFNRNFSIVFAKNINDVKDAVRAGRSVAVNRRDDGDFFVLGDYRLVKYARFLLGEFYPEYARLAASAADEMRAANDAPTASLAAAERRIAEYRAEFFAEGVNGK